MMLTANFCHISSSAATAKIGASKIERTRRRPVILAKLTLCAMMLSALVIA